MSSRSKLGKPKLMKLALGVVVTCIVVGLLVYAIQSGLLDSFFSKKTETSSDDYTPPSITIFTTASNVTGLGNYTQQTYFERGDTVYVYQEYINVFHNVSGIGMCNFSVNITVFDSNVGKRHSESVDVYLVDEVEEGRYWSFKTNESWPEGWYSVTSHLVDHISGKSTTGFDLFCLDCV